MDDIISFSPIISMMFNTSSSLMDASDEVFDMDDVEEDADSVGLSPGSSGLKLFRECVNGCSHGLEAYKDGDEGESGNSTKSSSLSTSRVSTRVIWRRGDGGGERSHVHVGDSLSGSAETKETSNVFFSAAILSKSQFLNH